MIESSQNSEKNYFHPFKVAFLGCCPVCGKGGLFVNFLDIVEKCSVCNLNIKQHDIGDGPAVFVVLIVGAIVVGASLILEVSKQPPLWLHAVIWIPTVIILSLCLLRFFKGFFCAINCSRRTDEL